MYLLCTRPIPGALPVATNYSRTGWAVEAESIGTPEPTRDTEAAVRAVQGWVSGGPCPDGFVTGTMMVEHAGDFEITKAWGGREYGADRPVYYIDGRRARGQNAARAVYEEAGPDATVRQEANESSTRLCGQSVVDRQRRAGIGALP